MKWFQSVLCTQMFIIIYRNSVLEEVFQFFLFPFIEIIATGFSFVSYLKKLCFLSSKGGNLMAHNAMADMVLPEIYEIDSLSLNDKTKVFNTYWSELLTYYCKYTNRNFNFFSEPTRKLIQNSFFKTLMRLWNLPIQYLPIREFWTPDTNSTPQ